MEYYKNMEFYSCREENGFVFTCITKANVYDAIVVRNPENCDCISPKKSYSSRTLEEHIRYINDKKLEKAVIIADSIEFITECPSLKYLEIYPSKDSMSYMDYSPLYSMTELRYLLCQTDYSDMGEKVSSKTTIDYSKIHGVTELWVKGAGHINYDASHSLETLCVYHDKKHTDINSLCKTANLKSLHVGNSSIKSLDGIENLVNLQELELGYNRRLADISELSSVKDSLRSLCIDNCPKIKDFACLKELHNMEFLDLRGKNDLPDLSFLNEMPNLKLFNFSMNVADGDLTPCLRVPYVDSMKNKKIYNLKNSQLPKKKPERGFEFI